MSYISIIPIVHDKFLAVITNLSANKHIAGFNCHRRSLVACRRGFSVQHTTAASALRQPLPFLPIKGSG